jgi:hypothetical protein
LSKKQQMFAHTQLHTVVLLYPMFVMQIFATITNDCFNNNKTHEHLSQNKPSDIQHQQQ